MWHRVVFVGITLVLVMMSITSKRLSAQTPCAYYDDQGNCIKPDFSDPPQSDPSAQLQPWVKARLLEYFPYNGYPSFSDVTNAASDAWDFTACLTDVAEGLGNMIGMYPQFPSDTSEECGDAWPTIQGLINATGRALVPQVQ